MTKWLQQLKENGKPNMSIMLVGNKQDLKNREVSYEEGKEFANTHGLVFTETSAKTAVNVKHAFTKVAQEIYANIQNGVHDLSRKGCGIDQGDQPPAIDVSSFRSQPEGKC